MRQVEELRGKRTWKEKNMTKFYTEKRVFQGIFGEDEYSKLNERYKESGVKIIYEYLSRANIAALSALNLTVDDILRGGGGLPTLQQNLAEANTNLYEAVQEKDRVDSEFEMANREVEDAKFQLRTTREILSPILENIGEEGGDEPWRAALRGYSGVGRKVRGSRIKSKKRKSKKKSHKRKSKKRRSKRRSKRR